MANPHNRNASAVLSLYKEIFTSSSTGMMVCSQSGFCLEVNEAMVKLYGVAEEQMLGQNIHRSAFWEGSGLIDATRLVVEREKEERKEITVTTIGGDRLALDTHILPIIRSDNMYLLYVFNDISTQKQVENTLQQSEQRYKELADSLPQIVFELDLHGNLTYSNLKGPEFTGYSLQEIKSGLNAFQMVAPEDRERLLENITRIIKERIESSNEYTIIRKDGTSFPAMISSKPIIEKNRVVGFRGVMIDLTEQKSVEEEKTLLESQLRQAQKMEALGTLTGGIAHDFNNILAIILGNAELAMVDLLDEHPAKHNIEQIRIASNRAKKLIKRLLTFTRQEKIENKPHYLPDLVRESLNTLQSTIPKTVTLEVNLPPAQETKSDDFNVIYGDATQIHQLLLNLCVNGVQAMNEKGILRISVDRVVFNETEIPAHMDFIPGRYEHLAVSDTGQGIDPELVDKIFDPFFTTKEIDKGTGIGLSVVQGIVKNHGGHILVDSKPSEGSVFHIYFPLAKERVGKEKKEEDIQLPMGSEHLLVVDDEEMVVTIMQSMLEQLGYSVTANVKSTEALRCFENNPHDFDLVITDQTMPLLSGSELAARMLEIRSDIPIIICTGYSRKVDDIKAKQIGISAFALKPIELQEIAKLVRQVLDDRTPLVSG